MYFVSKPTRSNVGLCLFLLVIFLLLVGMSALQVTDWCTAFCWLESSLAHIFARQ